MKKLKFALLSSICLASTTAFASDFQLGYINIDRVFSEAKPAKQIQQALKDKYSPDQQKLQTLNTQITNEQTQMQQIANKAPSFDKLSKDDQSQLKTLETKYQTDQTTFQKQYLAFQQSLQKSQEIALSLLMTKTNEILKDMSDKQGYDLVLTSNQIVYAKAKYDATDQVLAQLNKMDASDIIKQINNPTTQPSTTQTK